MVAHQHQQGVIKITPRHDQSQRLKLIRVYPFKINQGARSAQYPIAKPFLKGKRVRQKGYTQLIPPIIRGIGRLVL